MARDGSRQADHWQRKYYAALEELEEKEKAWGETEALLRRLATRLTLAADHRDPELDRLLETLRQALRNERNPQRLQKLVEAVSRLIARLDERETGAPDPAAPLRALFERLPIPEAYARQQRFVRRQLEKAQTPAEIEAVIGDLAELVELLLSRQPPATAATEAASSDDAEAGPEPKGLLGGLFRRRRPVDAPPPDPAPAEPAAMPAETGPDEAATCRLAADTLIRLLEQMQWPDALHAEAELIKRRLEPCRDAEGLQDGLLATAELFNGLQAQVQAEKRELEAFLRQLTERLAELDRDIRETARLQELSDRAGRDMDSRLRDEVSGIERSVADAEDLEALKTAVQSRVILIRNHMDRFLEQHSGYHEDAGKVIERLERQLEQTRDELERLQAEAESARATAMTDPLTGIPNRLAYDRRLEEELARFKRYGAPFALLVWDVDRFKAINDTYGHAAGDKVLTVIARLLRDRVRETDLTARYGGEEFVILMPETDSANAQPVAEKLREAIADTAFHFRGTRVPITASCGLTEARPGDDAQSLFQRADAALYRAKENGRNRVETA